MTDQKKRDDERLGRGGVTKIGTDGVPKQSGGTIGVDDPRHAELARKVAVADTENEGAFNRAPTYRDIDEQTVKERERNDKAAAAAARAPASSASSAPANNGGKS